MLEGKPYRRRTKRSAQPARWVKKAAIDEKGIKLPIASTTIAQGTRSLPR